MQKFLTERKPSSKAIHPPFSSKKKSKTPQSHKVVGGRMPFVSVVANVELEKDFLKNVSHTVAKYLKKPESV